MSAAAIVTAIAEARKPAVPIEDAKGRKRKQADILLDIGRQHDLFHDAGGDTFARLRRGDHWEVHAIESRSYREILSAEYLALTERGCNRNALGDAIDTLAAIARHWKEARPVWLRTAEEAGAIVLDSGAEDWGAIRVTADGWQVEPGGVVMFRRAGKPLPLPTPAKEGDFSRLWQYLNVDPADRVLVAGWMLGALRPGRNYAPLLLSGEQGSGKSTFTRLMKALLDPSASALRSPPRDARDLAVAAVNGWLLAIDNVSFLQGDLSDALCRIATGGAISERRLFTNTEEILVEVRRPMILNGIEELATRPDLAQRAVHVELSRVESRRTEADFWQAFAADAPAIFAGLLNGLSCALRNVATTHVNELPRMADFALWAEAGLPALGFEPGAFMAAYRRNQRGAMLLGLEGSAIGTALVKLMETCARWEGRSGDLLARLAELAGEGVTRSKAWPQSTRGMFAAFQRRAPALRVAGIEVQQQRTRHERLALVQKIVDENRS